MTSTPDVRPSLFLSALCLTLISSPLIAQPADPDPTARLQRPCLLCGVEHTGQMHIEQHKGRWVHTCPGCFPKWSENKADYFADLQARGALLDENTVSGKGSHLFWLITPLYLLIGLVCGAMCGYIAVTRGHNPYAWFLMGLVINVIALVAVNLQKNHAMERFPEGVPAGLRKVSMTRHPVACPGCSAECHPAAASCLACGRALDPKVTAETQNLALT